MTKQWPVIHVPLPSEMVPFIECFLLEQGALSIDITDAEDTPILEPKPGEHPLWSNSILCATFAPNTSAEEIRQSLQTLLPKDIFQKSYTSMIEGKNWVEQWYKDTQPIQIGKYLHIIPTHHSLASKPEGVVMQLDPGLAFGTGQHPTTQLCLQWLENHIVPDNSVIDYGCGSGILAIAALLLGSTLCHAIDIDPQALEACQNNAKLNKVLPHLHCHLSSSKLDIQANIVIANIISGILIQESEHLISMVKTDGLLVLCGILEDQLPHVIEHFTQTNEFSITQQEQWCLIAIPQHALTQKSTT